MYCVAFWCVVRYQVCSCRLSTDRLADRPTTGDGRRSYELSLVASLFFRPSTVRQLLTNIAFSTWPLLLSCSLPAPACSAVYCRLVPMSYRLLLFWRHIYNVARLFVSYCTVSCRIVSCRTVSCRLASFGVVCMLVGGRTRSGQEVERWRQSLQRGSLVDALDPSNTW